MEIFGIKIGVSEVYAGPIGGRTGVDTGLTYGGYAGDFGTLISRFVSIGIAVGGVLTLILLIWGGFKYISSAGDPKGPGEARDIITAGLVGFGIVFIAFWVVQLIELATGTQFLTAPF
jgi:hypothetical protein